MKTSLLTLATALALGVLAGCDRNANPDARTPAGPASTAPAGAGASTTPRDTAHNPPRQAEKREVAKPLQGQVYAKQSEQHKDFQQRGDAAGPKSPDTKPKSGG